MSLSHIAQALDLSVTTVSRALGAFADVSADTRARVEAEAARIGYRPNRAARMLRSGRSGAVAMVLPAAPGQFDDPFFLLLLMAVGASLERAGLDLMVTGARAGAEERAAFARLIAERRVDGVLIARTRVRDARIAALLDAGAHHSRAAHRTGCGEDGRYARAAHGGRRSSGVAGDPAGPADRARQRRSGANASPAGNFPRHGLTRNDGKTR